jgi:hypothetical protein
MNSHLQSARKRVLWLWVMLMLLVAQPAAWAQWNNVTPGVDYREFAVSGPNNVFVTRMDQQEQSVTIESAVAQGRLSGGRETVSGMVARYDDTIGFWGQEWGRRYEVVAAINGNFFDLNSGVPEPGQIQSGYYAWRYGQWGGRSGFAWTVNRTAFIGACIYHPPDGSYVTFADQSTQEIVEINKTPGSGELTLLTHHYDTHTPGQSAGVEVLVEMDRPTFILPAPHMAEGTVVEVRSGQGETPLYFDHVVLSAAGGAASTLQSKVSVGDRIGITQEFLSYELDCNTSNGLDWTKTYAGVGGNFQFLKDGVVQSSSDPGLTARHPRTAVALDASYVYFIVVDGRSGVSVGMNMTELADFCKNELGATDGVNHDGGGSSAMWVDGQIRNDPSDGSERTVANGLMIVRVHPKDLSSAYYAGDTVAATVSTAVRLGPGTHFGEVSSVSAGTEGAVRTHEALGVLAKGVHWWPVDFNGVYGWVDESALELIARDPDAGVLPPPDGAVDGAVDGAQPPDASVMADGAVGDGAVAVDGSNVNPGVGGGCSCRQQLGKSDVLGSDRWVLLILFGVFVGFFRRKRA